MKKFSLAFLALAAALAITPAALADSWTFTINGGGFTSDLTLTGSQVAPGVFTIATVSGTFWNSDVGTVSSTNNAFTVIPLTSPVSPSGTSYADGYGFLYDNLLFPGDPHDKYSTGNGVLDWGGLLLSVAGDVDGSNNYILNIFSSSIGGPGNNGDFYWADNYHAYANIPIGDLDVPNVKYSSLTPEPGSLFLLGTGLLGLAVILFRKASKQHSSGMALSI
jgi:hypothetical protein